MKKIQFLIVFLILLFTSMTFAQSAFTTGYNPKVYKLNENGENHGIVYQHKGTIDTVGTDIDTLYTEPFQFWAYDASPYTYPINYTVQLSSGTQSTRALSVFVLGSNTLAGVFAVVDTLCLQDSSGTILAKTINFNGYRRAYYKLKIFKGATKNKVCTFDIKGYAYKKD